MLWEVEIRPLGRDGERERVCDEFDLLTHGRRGVDLVKASARGFLFEGDVGRDQVETLVEQLIVDSLVESAGSAPIVPPAPAPAPAVPDQSSAESRNVKSTTITVLLKPGVMDPVSESVLDAARDLGVSLTAVRSFRRYFAEKEMGAGDREALFRKVLANDAIEQIVLGPLHTDHLAIGRHYQFRLVGVTIHDLDDKGLDKLSQDGQLALNLDEMKAIQAHFREMGREPIDVELETLAQTWSEHCSHKTLKGPIDFTELVGGKPTTRRIDNLLKQTIFASTQELRGRLGDKDWCVSVFSDNAGVVRFDENYHVCFKVETHNHPSAIEPYGGANTGLGGVIRDPLGTCLGAKPIANTDVFCFAPPDHPPEKLPPGILHPRRIMQGVVAGVKDYGNRMGIPTINGAVLFDDRYLANPLVYCGTVGLIPTDRTVKQVHAGDLIVAVGGRTGRDGIHGATFSSLELTAESETVSGGAVQIGNAITEKKLLDVILQARDLGLYSAITDCGAGGFSSAVGEMGAQLGAEVQLDKAPLKYTGLSYTEIWISESQERMVLAVPPANWARLEALCRGEGVEAAVLGEFQATGRLKLLYEGRQVGDLSMHFLHEGRPAVLRRAEWFDDTGRPDRSAASQIPMSPPGNPQSALLAILASYSVCSKEWVIRQYDHEVQGGSVIKPLTGAREDGPSDASVIVPVLGSWQGLAIGCGINPRYGDHDPYWMAASGIDEALRNVVSVGADPARTAILDNFCWGNVNEPRVLGSLVRAAEACRDVALAFGTPFISGKDSLYNAYSSAGRKISIPGTLLISAMGQVSDVRRCVTMDLKEPGNDLILIGSTRNELAGSHYHLVMGRDGGNVPKVDLESAPKIFHAVHSAINLRLIRSCHDLSEGGLAVALAEMAFAGEIGADITGLKSLSGCDNEADDVRLFSESPTRFLVEVKPEHLGPFQTVFAGLPLAILGRTISEPRLRIAGSNGEWIVWAKLSELKEVWQAPLRW